LKHLVRPLLPYSPYSPSLTPHLILVSFLPMTADAFTWHVYLPLYSVLLSHHIPISVHQ
jgi:hypothetical protein